MKVKLLIPRSGPSASHNIGDEIEVDDAEGKRLIEAGKASPVGGKSKRTATAPKHETPED